MECYVLYYVFTEHFVILKYRADLKYRDFETYYSYVTGCDFVGRSIMRSVVKGVVAHGETVIWKFYDFGVQHIVG